LNRRALASIGHPQAIKGQTAMADGNMTIRDIDVPFWRIVTTLVKWSIASIPAIIILTILAALFGVIVAGILDLAGVTMPPPPMSP
jgi:hypothetical protein